MKPAMAAALALLAVVAVACANDPPPKVPPGFDPNFGGVCGVDPIACFDMDGNYSGTCCWQGTTCGGGKWSVGCFAGDCCDIQSGPSGGWGDEARRLPAHVAGKQRRAQ